MGAHEAKEQLLGMFSGWITELVKQESPDLTARQLAIFLTCYLDNDAQTVRGLAANLGISKPAVSRALDRLASSELIRRKDDPVDRRSILVQRTRTGHGFLGELRRVLKAASAKADYDITPDQPNSPPL